MNWEQVSFVFQFRFLFSTQFSICEFLVGLFDDVVDVPLSDRQDDELCGTTTNKPPFVSIQFRSLSLSFSWVTIDAKSVAWSIKVELSAKATHRNDCRTSTQRTTGLKIFDFVAIWFSVFDFYQLIGTNCCTRRRSTTRTTTQFTFTSKYQSIRSLLVFILLKLCF